MSLKSNVTSRVAVAAVTAGLTLCFWATPALANDAVAENLDQEPAVVYVSLAAVEEAEPTEAVKDVIAADAGSETAVVSSPGIEFDGKEGQPISSPVVDTELRDDEEHSGDAGHNAEKNPSSDSKADPESSTDPKPAPEPEPEPEPEPKPQKGWWTDAATGAREYYNQGVLVWRLSADGTLECFATDDFDYDSRRFLVVGHAEAVTPHNVSYTDPDTGLRYWYENGRRVEEHCYVDHETFEWSWADKGGVVACGKDVYIPRDETRKNADGTWGDGKWVRVDDSYSLVKGEDYRKSTNDGKMHWWLFDAETGEMLKNFVHVSSNGGKWCYYDDTYGWMVYGEQYRMTKDDPSAGYHWYYFDDYTGATSYGYRWVKDSSDSYYGGKTCYYDTTMGWMFYNWHNINGTWNYFDKYTGRQCAKSNAAWRAKEWLNWAGGRSGATNGMYVMVDKGDLRTMVFRHDSTDGWVPVQDYLCSVASASGNNGNGTVEGIWHLGLLTNDERGVTNGSVYDHGPYGFGAQIDNFRNAGSTGIVWSGPAIAKIAEDKFAHTSWRYHYLQDQGIHSTVHNGGDESTQLGKRNTDGCVRLSNTDCKWIFEQIPMYTTIRIYSDVRF